MDSDDEQTPPQGYLESRILSAHPVEIVAMLYEVAIDSLNDAIAQLRARAIVLHARGRLRGPNRRFRNC